MQRGLWFWPMLCILAQHTSSVKSAVCQQSSELGRRFCLYEENRSWEVSEGLCRDKDARLVWDTEDTTHGVLRDLVRRSGVSSSWIGARVGPLYYNWMNNELSHIGTFYQGCYPRGTPPEFREVCRLKPDITSCLSYCTDYLYMGLFGYHPGLNTFWCCCDNSFGMRGEGNSAQCPTRRNNLRIAIDSSYNAVYRRDARVPERSVWETGYPAGLTDHQGALCLVVNASTWTGTARVRQEHRTCVDEYYPLCLLEPIRGRECASGEYSMTLTGMCVRYLETAVSWEAAVAQCDVTAPARSSRLLSFYTPSVNRDLELVVQNYTQNATDMIFWIFGSSRRWVWQDGTTTRQDVENDYWRSPLDKFVRDRHCILLNIDANWTAVRCGEIKGSYICESDRLLNTTTGSTSYHFTTAEPLTSETTAKVTSNQTLNATSGTDRPLNTTAQPVSTRHPASTTEFVSSDTTATSDSVQNIYSTETSMTAGTANLIQTSTSRKSEHPTSVSARSSVTERETTPHKGTAFSSQNIDSTTISEHLETTTNHSSSETTTGDIYSSFITSVHPTEITAPRSSTKKEEGVTMVTREVTMTTRGVTTDTSPETSSTSTKAVLNSTLTFTTVAPLVVTTDTATSYSTQGEQSSVTTDASSTVPVISSSLEMPEAMAVGLVTGVMLAAVVLLIICWMDIRKRRKSTKMNRKDLPLSYWKL